MIAVLFSVLCLVVFTFDYLCCFLYCSYKKRKSNINVTATVFQRSNSLTDSNQLNAKQNNHKGGGKINVIKPKIFTFLDSHLRFMLLLTSYVPSHSVRNFMYRHVFQIHLAKTACIYYGVEIRAPWNLYIDDGTIIGDKAILDARNGIYIGKNVNLSTGVWIWTMQHNVNSENFSSEGAPVFISDRSWLSCRTVILPGVHVAEGTVIAAGAVCTKDTEPFKIYGGVPCKKINERSSRLNYMFNGKSLFFL